MFLLTSSPVPMSVTRSVNAVPVLLISVLLVLVVFLLLSFTLVYLRTRLLVPLSNVMRFRTALLVSEAITWFSFSYDACRCRTVVLRGKFY